jgi:hypothetical protein
MGAIMVNPVYTTACRDVFIVAIMSETYLSLETNSSLLLL